MSRLNSLLSRSALALAALSMGGCALWTDETIYPYTTTAPITDFGREIHELYALITYIVLAVFVLVTVLMAYVLVRYRDDGSEGNPEQIHGNLQMEIGWTLGPIFLVLVMIIPTIQTIFRIADAPPAGATVEDGTFKPTVEIRAVGKRWWWAFDYINEGFSTGNHIAIPDDRPVSVQIVSDTVIHSFWVPRLGGKRDAVPGRVNRIWFNMEKDIPKGAPEHLRGECAEYCGEAHALMRFEVMAMDGSDFDQWVAEYQRGPEFEDEGMKERGEAAFLAGGCIACHKVTGNDAANGKIGPDLTFFGDRRYLAAGVHDMFGPNSLHRTPDPVADPSDRRQILKKWIRHPDSMKPGTARLANGEPRFDGMVIPKDANKDGVLSEEELSEDTLDAIVDYLFAQESSFPLRPVTR